MSKESPEYARVAQVVRSVLGAPSTSLDAAAIDRLITGLAALVVDMLADERRRWQAVREVVEAQVQDEGLDFTAQTAAEAYLQQELRKVHAAVEAVTAAAPSVAASGSEKAGGGDAW